MLRVRRVYEPPDPADGYRVLVDRLWPRGLTKEAAHVDAWLRDLAPSDDLRRCFAHDPARWPAFRERYRAALLASPHHARLDELAQRMRVGAVTLLYAARDAARNNAVVLAEVLDELAGDPHRGT
ncbi:MAG: DUF488 family protein [Chloroflexi bacterium]|nr:DUF488 family protein [Chloroflexota bacterium]